MKYRRIALLLAAASLLSPPARAQSRRLNGPLPRPGAADLLDDFALSRDGSRLVFRGDVFVDEAFELLSSPANASAPPVRLNGPLVAGGDVVRFALGSQRAAYVADQDADEVFELYSAPIAGGAALKLSGTLAAGGDVTAFLLTPDGASAVFLADALVDRRPEFFRVPLDGSAAPIALDPSPSTDAVVDYRMAPDGARILFTRSELDTGGPSYFFFQHLFALALDGSQAKIEIAETHPASPGNVGADGSFSAIDFSPDSRHAVYVDQTDAKDGPEEIVLHSALVDGSAAPIVLSQNTLASFLLSPSLARVVFFGSGNLYSSALDGTARVQLDPPGVTPLQPFALTPDGTSVVFQAGEPTNNTRVLYWARVDGSQPARVLDGPRTFLVTELVLTDTRAFYSTRVGSPIASQSFGGVYATPLDGSAAPVLLNGPAVVRTGGSGPNPAPGGELVFRNSYSVDSDVELYAVPQDGSSAPRRLSPPMTNGRDVERFLLTPDGAGVVYRSDQTFDGAFELNRTSLSGGTPRNFHPLSPGPVVGDVLSFRVSPDGGSVVFLADQETDEEFRFYRVPTSGKTGPTRVGRFTLFPGPYQDEYALAPAGDRVVRFNTKYVLDLTCVSTAPGSIDVRLGVGRVAGPLRFTPDGTRLVFRRDYSGINLVSIALDGSGLVTLSGLVESTTFGYELTPDGSTVVFQKDRRSILRIPVAGGAPAVRLNPLLAIDRIVSAFRITPGGASVAYIADQRTDELFELFVAPLDQSSPARRLSGALAPSGDVADFAFTPDGKRAVYRADAAVDGRLDLFSVPLAPSARGFQRVLGAGEPDAVQLTSGARSVEPDYRVAVDGTQVFYRTDVRTGALDPARFRLFRVPVLGRAAPAPLSHEGASVLSFELSPDKARIVYLAEEGGAQGLFSVGTSGGMVVALDSLPAFAEVSVYRVTPDSAVVYLCDREQDGELQLFRAPLDGSAPAAALNDPLPPGGDVLADFVVLPDGRVVYGADQESDDVFELFATPVLVRR